MVSFVEPFADAIGISQRYPIGVAVTNAKCESVRLPFGIADVKPERETEWEPVEFAHRFAECRAVVLTDVKPKRRALNEPKRESVGQAFNVAVRVPHGKAERKSKCKPHNNTNRMRRWPSFACWRFV